MLPSIGLSLNKSIPYSTLALILPIVPGGVLAGGLAARHHELFLEFLALPQLGYGTKLALIAFGSWLCGGVFQCAVYLVVGVVASVLIWKQLIFQRPEAEAGAAYRNVTWRRVTRRLALLYYKRNILCYLSYAPPRVRV
jgi:hypothetical protein